MGMIIGLCLIFYVFFCKPVDVAEGISLRACCSDGGVCKVGVGGGWLFSKGVGMLITDNTGMGLYLEEVDGQWWLALDSYTLFFLRGHQSKQAFLTSFFPVLDLLV